MARLAAFRKGLREGGFVEGHNVSIEFRWASGQFSRLPEMAADLVSRQVTVIVSPAETAAVLVAKAATRTIPIIFASAADPVATGLVNSLNRPGGNVTGISIMSAELAPKRLALLRDLVPRATHFNALVNPNNPLSNFVRKELEVGATALGMQLNIVQAGTDSELETAFAAISRKPDGGLLAGTDSFFYVRRAEIVALAARYALPTVYDNRDYVQAGGLVSYGPDITYAIEQAGVYTARVLKGEKPTDLPVLQPAKFETVINLKTAKALGLEIPSKYLFTADDVIE